MNHAAAKHHYLVISRGKWDEAATKEDVQGAIDRFYDWHERNVEAGRALRGSRLGADGKVVSRRSITDGPFTETKEVLGGYAIFEFATREDAIASAINFMELHAKYAEGWEGVCEMRPMFSDVEDGCASTEGLATLGQKVS